VDEFLTRHNLGKRVVMLGEVPPSQMSTLMTASDIVFLPSEIEGIASILFEALAIENVVVGADVGGQVELVTPEVGFLLNLSAYDNDRSIATLASAYAEQLEKLILNTAKVKEMGKRGREMIASRFTLDHMVQDMEDIFCEAVKERDKGSLVSLPKKTAIETASQALESINTEEQAYDMWKKGEQLKQKLDELRLGAAQCDAEHTELITSRANLARCNKEQGSIHEQYIRCEQDLATMYIEVDELRSQLNKDEEQP